MMIKRQFIAKQVRKSVRTKCTSLFLRRLVFQTVDTVARTHYGHDYAMKCLQTAEASRMLLEEVGIESRLTAGAVCVPKILTNGQFGGWTGYWGDHHHVWLETEFNEVADLALSQLHEHPELVSVKCRRLQFGGTKEMAGLQSFATCSIPHLVAFHCRH